VTYNQIWKTHRNISKIDEKQDISVFLQNRVTKSYKIARIESGQKNTRFVTRVCEIPNFLETQQVCTFPGTFLNSLLKKCKVILLNEYLTSSLTYFTIEILRSIQMKALDFEPTVQLSMSQ
jgi:hypothetical protein